MIDTIAPNTTQTFPALHILHSEYHTSIFPHTTTLIYTMVLRKNYQEHVLEKLLNMKEHVGIKS